MDSTGRIHIEPVFKDTRDFIGDLCQVKFEDNKWGYISKQGELIWKPK